MWMVIPMAPTKLNVTTQIMDGIANTLHPSVRNCKSSVRPQRNPEAEPMSRREIMVFAAVSDVLQQLRLYQQRGALLQHCEGHEHL
jgi:hypothetical protein